jgi:hypothetical protein
MLVLLIQTVSCFWCVLCEATWAPRALGRAGVRISLLGRRQSNPVKMVIRQIAAAGSARRLSGGLMFMLFCCRYFDVYRGAMSLIENQVWVCLRPPKRCQGVVLFRWHLFFVAGIVFLMEVGMLREVRSLFYRASVLPSVGSGIQNKASRYIFG